MTELLTSIASGLGVGAVYAMIALGYAFIYRTTASFNFAQGQLLMFGGLFAYTFYQATGLPAAVAIVISIVLVGLIGILIERLAIFPLARRGDDSMSWLISTLGMAILLTGAAERIWGTQPLGVRNFLGPDTLAFGSVRISTPYVIAFGVAVLIAVLIELFYRFTLWGRAMKAVGENRTAVELAGVNVMLLGVLAFAIGGALTGLAGFVLAPVTYAQTDTGFSFAILAFAAVAIGGFSSHWGALVGGLLIGVVESLSGTYVSLNAQDIIVLGLLLAVLMVRPTGLFTARSARAV